MKLLISLLLLLFLIPQSILAENEKIHFPFIFSVPQHKLDARESSLWLDNEKYVESTVASPENLLSAIYKGSRQSMYNVARTNGYNGVYMVALSLDDPTVTPFYEDTFIIDYGKLEVYRDIIIQANEYNLHVILLLAEEETLRYPWREWYIEASNYFSDLNIMWIISEEFNQYPHGLTYEEVNERCMFMRNLDSETPIGIHQTGESIYHFQPYLDNECLDFFSIQWFRSRNPMEAIDWLQPRTNKYLTVHEPVTITEYTTDEWCNIVKDLHANNVGVGLYNGDMDQYWIYKNLPSCYQPKAMSTGS